MWPKSVCKITSAFEGKNACLGFHLLALAVWCDLWWQLLATLSQLLQYQVNQTVEGKHVL